MQSEQLPSDVDAERPSAARVYDYLLGGAHNFASDRQMAEQMLAVYPEAPYVAQANRAFLRRAVQFLAESGVRQFLDIGSGIPTVGHVHEIAQGIAPDARVAYVDIDPIAVAHSRHLLRDNPRATVLQADVRQPGAILVHPGLRRLLDLDQPVAVLVIALFHFVGGDSDVAGIVSRLMEPLAAGSYLAISHGTQDGTDIGDKVVEVYRRAGIELVSRTRAQVQALFDGFELVEPGVVWVPQWRPDPAAEVDDPARSANYAGVARMP